MLLYPSINPIAVSLGPLAIHWYGIMYLIGFVSAWALLHWRSTRKLSIKASLAGQGYHSEKNTKGPQYQPYSFTQANISDIIFYGALGVILGGRIGYVLFYNIDEFLQTPVMIVKIWQGGMSFHGGLLGVIIAMFCYAKKIHCHPADLTDFIAPVVPIGLGAGRIGNFINGELWGKVTQVPWAMVFPHGGPLARHPSELYEFLLEGVLFFIILWRYSSKPRPRYAVSGLFLLAYGIFRFFIEFFREPDVQLGYLLWHWVTMGQVLCFPMMIIGFGMMIYAYRHRLAPM